MDELKDEDKIIQTAKKRFSHCVDEEAENREEALEDLEFCEGNQWPSQIKDEREKEGRPCLTINKVPQYVRQVVNDIRQIRPSIKVRPVDNQSDPDTAEIIQGMIRAIEQDSAAESAYDWAAEYAVKCGVGYWRILTEYADDDSFDQVVKIERVRNPFSVYLDPGAENQDGSDAKWGFVVQDMPKEEFEAKYPDADSSWTEYGSTGDRDWFSEDSVRVAEYWCVETEKAIISMFQNPETGEMITFDGEVEGAIAIREVERKKIIQRLITGKEVLEETVWPGKYIPIIRVFGREVDIEGEVKWKGMVRDIKDPQRMYNYHRSAEVERTALYSKAPWVGPKGAFKSQKWRTANAKNHAYLEYDGQVPPFRDPPPEVSSAMVHQIQLASEEFKGVTGIHDAGVGARSNEVSGIAINERRGEADVSNFDFVDNLAKAMTYSGRVLVDLIPKVYSGARMVRIVNPDGSDDLVEINRPYVDSQMRQRNYQIEAGRYDVAVDIGPSYATKREEAVSSMLEVLKAFPQAAEVMGDLLAKNMDWPEADEISKRLKTLMPMEIFQDENPQFKQAMQMKDAQIGQLQQQMQSLMAEAQRMAVELQNKQQKSQIDQAELARKIKKDLMDHIEGMTDLEIKAAKDLSPQGMAY